MTRQQTLVYFAIGILNIIATVAQLEWLNNLTKPLLMLSLAFFYFQATKSNLKLSDKVMLFALIFSCVGDCFLMFQGKPAYYFILGLGSFLLAHLCYTYVFSREIKVDILKILPMVFYGIFMQYYLLSHISSSEFKIPVFAYISVISFMVMMAISRKTTSKSYQIVLLGAIIFAISDSCIGINKFVNPIPYAGFCIMITYITAQYLIVKGVLLGRQTVA